MRSTRNTSYLDYLIAGDRAERVDERSLDTVGVRVDLNERDIERFRSLPMQLSAELPLATVLFRRRSMR